MRGPGATTGAFALESAMDDLAYRLGIDPIELRLRNEPDRDPYTGLPFSDRRLADCLREGARRFGWHDRDPRPGVRREGRWLVGTGVASSVYPTMRQAQSSATIRFEDGRYVAEIGAADLGTGAWTVLPQIAADALGVPVEHVDVRIGDTRYPIASVAGGSSGTNTWGSAITVAAREFRTKFGTDPRDGDEATGDVDQASPNEEHSAYAFGAQFAEVRVNADTGEIRLPRLLGVFAAGRIINPRTARSQLIGGMTMGMSMALHENSVFDTRIGQVANHDLAEYHITVNADVGSIEAHWLDEHDPYVNVMGSKGIGEIGITGTAAAVVNAVHHATGVRVRDLPVTLDKLLPGLPWRPTGTGRVGAGCETGAPPATPQAAHRGAAGGGRVGPVRHTMGPSWRSREGTRHWHARFRPARPPAPSGRGSSRPSTATSSSPPRTTWSRRRRARARRRSRSPWPPGCCSGVRWAAWWWSARPTTCGCSGPTPPTDWASCSTPASPTPSGRCARARRAT
jgi:CO/xanthine dehydrogenase Mo-binding subunit